MEFCGMKREIDRKCLNHARVHANAQSFDRCEARGIIHVSLRKRKFDKKIRYCCRDSFFVEKDI